MWIYTDILIIKTNKCIVNEFIFGKLCNSILIIDFYNSFLLRDSLTLIKTYLIEYNIKNNYFRTKKGTIIINDNINIYRYLYYLYPNEIIYKKICN